MKRVKIKLDNGRVIIRTVKCKSIGNFVVNIVRYDNKKYLIGDGDEYLRGYDKIFTLGKCIVSDLVLKTV